MIEISPELISQFRNGWLGPIVLISLMILIIFIMIGWHHFHSKYLPFIIGFAVSLIFAIFFVCFGMITATMILDLLK